MFHCLRIIPEQCCYLRLLTILFLCFIWSNSTQAVAGEIQITIKDSTTKRPLAKVTVDIIPRQGNKISASTNNNGIAVVGNLAEGLYNVLVAHPGYLTSRSPSVRVIDRKSTPLRVELTQNQGDLEETLVIANTKAIDLTSSVGTRYIDRETLRSAAGSGSDVLRALDGLPGLFSSGEFASFTVRGRGPRDNLIFVDDIPFDRVVHFDDSFGEQEEIEGGGRYSVFAPNLIGGAEFQPGGWSAAYSGKAGSLLRLNVAEGNFVSPSYTTRIDLAGCEVGYDGPSGFDGDTSILFSARRLNFGSLFETIGIDDIGTPKLTDIIFKSTSQLTSDDKLNILMIYAPEEFNRNIDNVLASDEDDPGNFEDVELVDNDADNSLLAFTWSHLFGNSGELTNKLYLRNFDENSATGEAFPDLVAADTTTSDVPIRNNIIVSRRQEKEIGLRSDLSMDSSLGRFSAGLRATQLDLSFQLTLDDDWTRFIYDQDDFRPLPEQRFIVLTPNSVNSRFEEKNTSYATFLEQTIEFDQLALRAGLRYDRDQLSDEDLLAPRIGANWFLSKKLNVSATVGAYFQAPRFNDRASDTSNTALENERIHQLSLGFRYFLNTNIEVIAEPYYQDLDNLIVEQDGVNLTSVNTGEGRSYGIDTAITRRFNNSWSAHLNYSYNNSKIKDNKDLPLYNADFSRPHSVSLGGVWEISSRWKLSAR